MLRKTASVQEHLLLVIAVQVEDAPDPSNFPIQRSGLIFLPVEASKNGGGEKQTSRMG